MEQDFQSVKIIKTGDMKLNPKNFFDLPFEMVRIKVYKYLQPPDRKNMRLVNSEIKEELDSYVGVVKTIWLKSLRHTPQFIFKFLQSSTFNGLGIRSNLLGIPFNEVISYPKDLEFFHFHPCGIISPDVGNKILTQCPNIKYLFWHGLTVGGITPGKIPLENLTGFVVDIVSPIYINMNTISKHFFRYWKNQKTLIENIVCSKVIDAHFRVLQVDRNKDTTGTYDKMIAHTVINFLYQNPKLDVFVLTFISLPDVEINGSPPPQKVKIPLRPSPPEGLKIKSFRISAGDDREIASIFLNLVDRVEDMEELYLAECGLIFWTRFEQTLEYKIDTMVKLTIKSSFSEEVLNIGVINRMKGLKVLILVKMNYDFAPSFLSLDKPAHDRCCCSRNYVFPRNNANLEVLAIVNFRMTVLTLKTFRCFRKLKHLVVLSLDFPNFEHPLESIKRLLEIRSLESILVNKGLFAQTNQVDAFFNTDAKQFLGNRNVPVLEIYEDRGNLFTEYLIENDGDLGPFYGLE